MPCRRVSAQSPTRRLAPRYTRRNWLLNADVTLSVKTAWPHGNRMGWFELPSREGLGGGGELSGNSRATGVADLHGPLTDP
jgi:hypothetical protein